MLPASQVVQGYVLAGYTTLVITDHLGANRYKSDASSLSERAELFLKGYRLACREAEKWGIHVLPGAEAQVPSGDEHFLLLGMEEKHFAPLMGFLDERPGVDELYTHVSALGILMVQAHPFRPNCRAMPSHILDGIEIYNGNPRHNSQNHVAREYAAANGLMMVSGSDTHQLMDLARGGILSEGAITSRAELVTTLRSGKFETIETLTGFLHA